MNKARKAALAKALPLLVQVQALLAEARKTIASVKDDEEEVYGNLSDGQQSGELGEAMQSAISDMEEALDGIDGLDLKDVAEAVGRVCEADEDLASPSIDEAEMESRRMARLPGWAKERIARAEDKANDADARLASSFSVRNPDDLEEITVDDYLSPLRGKVIPSTQLAFPAYGIRVSTDRHGRGVAIDGVDFGSLIVMPQSGNGIIVKLDRSH